MNTTTPTTNTLGGTTRYEIGPDGKDYIVAPVAMLVPGVHNGSNGALLYPADELAKAPAAWDGKPVTVGHPAGGAYVPGQTVTIGTIKNTRYDGKLRAEAWLDPHALVYHAEELYHALENGGTVEVSTGLYTVNEPVPGTDPGGVPYAAIARNYTPDHLAILTDQPGACSVAAGCGLPVANAEPEPPKKEEPMQPDEMLALPVMNFGNPNPHPPACGADDVGDGLPLPVMNFAGCGCGDRRRDTAPAGARHQSPEATANAATGGDDGGLPLPRMF